MGSEVAFSTHPHAAQAAGECIGNLVEATAGPPDLAVVAVTPPFAEQLGDVVALTRHVLAPRVTLGLATAGVMAGEALALDGPGLGVLTWTADAPDAVIRPVRAADADELVAAVSGSSAADALVLFADPFSFPAEVLLEALAGAGTPTVLCGGYVAASARRGGNRMALDGDVLHGGAVGVVLEAARSVSLRCTGGALVGPPMVVTRSEGTELIELDGRRALAVAEAMALDLGLELDVVAALQHGVLRLSVADPRASVPTASAEEQRERSMVVTVVGVDPDAATLRCDRAVPLGARVVFEVVDEWSAGADLHRRLADLGWPSGDEARLVVSDVDRFEGSSLVVHSDVGALTRDDPSSAVLGVVTSGVLHRRSGVPTLEQAVFTLTMAGLGTPREA